MFNVNIPLIIYLVYTFRNFLDLVLKQDYSKTKQVFFVMYKKSNKGAIPTHQTNYDVVFYDNKGVIFRRVDEEK